MLNMIHRKHRKHFTGITGVCVLTFCSCVCAAEPPNTPFVFCVHLASEHSSAKMGITLRCSVSPVSRLANESSDSSSDSDVSHPSESIAIHHRELIEVPH